MPEHSREDAYRLSTPGEHRVYYDAWAPTYDADFILARGYQVPTDVAAAFVAHERPGDSPIADIGCGTGQLGRALGGRDIDGFDVSPAMLDEAAASGAYRRLLAVDLTNDDALKFASGGGYGGVVSSGTFTHGHLGPRDLVRLLGLGHRGALYAIGINADYFAAAGFAPVLETQAAAGRVVIVDEVEARSYADDDLPDEPVNRTRTVVFRLAD